MSGEIRRAIDWAFVPVFLYFSLSVRSPDLLTAGLLCFYLGLMFDPEYAKERHNGILCGALGGFAYLAKPYAFYFFIPHFILLSALQMHFTSDRGARRKSLKHLLIGLLVFSLISVPWVTQLSQKYGRPTVGTAGSYNHARTHPASWGSFYLEGVIAAPPNGTAVSIMEDPTGLPVPAWSPVESLGSMTYQATVIVKNIHDIFLSCSRFFPLTAAVLLGYLLLVAVRMAIPPGHATRVVPVTDPAFLSCRVHFICHQRALSLGPLHPSDPDGRPPAVSRAAMRNVWENPSASAGIAVFRAHLHDRAGQDHRQGGRIVRGQGSI